MKLSVLLALFAVLGADALAPPSPKATKPAFDLKQAAAGTFAAITIASNAFMPIANAADFQMPAAFSSSTIVSEKVVREGIYKDYEADLFQETDDAKSTFKSAKETKSKKGKYTALLSVLVIGSFIIPMAQYFWYVREDDSFDNFFAKKVPEPEPEPPKKKNFFGR